MVVWTANGRSAFPLQTGKKQVDLLLAACNVGRPYCEGVFCE